MIPIQTMKCVKNNEPNTQPTCTAITFWILFKMCRKCAFMPLCVQVIYGIKIHTTNSLSKSSQANSKSKCYFDYISNDSTKSWWGDYQSERLLVNFVRILLSFEAIFTISGEMLIAPLYEQKNKRKLSKLLSPWMANNFVWMRNQPIIPGCRTALAHAKCNGVVQCDIDFNRMPKLCLGCRVCFLFN